MTDRERLIELLCEAECKGPENQFTCPERRHGQCRSIKRLEMCQINNLADTILSDGWIRPPCKVGDKVAVRALCECVETVPDICPFKDDCDCEDCDNSNERIFSTEISSIFNDGSGWKVTFKNLCFIEGAFSDIGTSFFVGDDAEKQAEKALAEREAKNEKP